MYSVTDGTQINLPKLNIVEIMLGKQKDAYVCSIFYAVDDFRQARNCYIFFISFLFCMI